MRTLAGILIHAFFRTVEVENADFLPTRAPTIVVAVHRNGLVDGLLLMAALGRYPRFLGKSTLFKIPPLWPFLKLAGVVPVHRASDGPSPSQNASAFVVSRRILSKGGMLAVFPEGISHDAPRLQTLRTGVARIALEASIDDGIEDVTLVPLGISYDAKARFRSRALVRVGQPVSVSGWAARCYQDRQGAVRAVTDEMAVRLRALEPSYRSWGEAADLSMVAEIAIRDLGSVEPKVVDLGRREELVRKLAEMVRVPGANHRSESLCFALARYQRQLALLGLDDGQVATSAGGGRLGRVLARALTEAVFAMPVALAGTAIHIVPYEAVRRIALIPDNEGMRSTVKVLGCFAGFVTVYAVIASRVGRRFGRLMGIAAFGAGPASGYVAVHFFERLQRIGGLVEVVKLARGRQTTLASLLGSRAAVVTAADELLSLWGPDNDAKVDAVTT